MRSTRHAGFLFRLAQRGRGGVGIARLRAAAREADLTGVVIRCAVRRVNRTESSSSRLTTGTSTEAGRS